MRSVGFNAVVLILLAAGCARRWSRPGATERDFLIEQTRCEALASPCMGKRTEDGGCAGVMGSVSKDHFDRCMKVQGWHPGARKLGGEVFDG